MLQASSGDFTIIETTLLSALPAWQTEKITFECSCDILRSSADFTNSFVLKIAESVYIDEECWLFSRVQYKQNKLLNL